MTPSRGLPTWFAAFLVLACAALCVLVVVQRRQNQGLADQVRILTEQIGHSALPRGELLKPLDSFGRSPETPGQSLAPFSFGDGRPATLLFVHDSTCGACEEILPRVESLSREWTPLGVRVVGVQLDAKAPAGLAHAASSLEIRGVAMNQGTWLARVPVMPSLILTDGEGRVRGAWYGVPMDAQWSQIHDDLRRAVRGWRD